MWSTSRPWFALATLIAAGLMSASYVASNGRGIGVPGWGVPNLNPPWPAFTVSVIGETEVGRPIFRIVSHQGVIRDCAYIARANEARSDSGLRCHNPVRRTVHTHCSQPLTPCPHKAAARGSLPRNEPRFAMEPR